MRQCAWSENCSTKLPINEGRRTWYLVLQIGFPADTRVPGRRRSGYLASTYGDAAARHLKVVSTVCEPLGVTIRRLNVSVGSGGDGSGHYLFRFRRYGRDDRGAARLAEAFAYGLSIAGRPLADTDDPLVLRVPDTAVRGKHTAAFECLMALDQSRLPEHRSLTLPDISLAAVSMATSDAHEIAWRIAAVTFKNAALFDATRFLQRSYENFYVYPGGITEVMSDPDDTPTTGAGQNRFEDALHSAFMAIEAVIGDPPRDDRRLFAKLADIGVDPHEEAGYVDKIPIARMIRRMNEARDKKSAHGSTRHRRIAAAELLNFQACADVIVTAALERARGSPLAT